MTNSDVWGEDAALRAETSTDPMDSPAVVGPTADFLADLAGAGRALEFAVGAGRIALPLLERGVRVWGIELSEPMVALLRRRADEDALPVTVGDMATTRVEGEFTLVYLVYNTIGNLFTQDAQVECFRNAARHLTSGGRFVIEVLVPPLRRMPPGQDAVPFDVSEEHLGFDTVDLVTQQAVSHHYHRGADGRYSYSRLNFRQVWPSELDLMARLAGMELEARYADWDRSPFTAESDKHVSVWRKS